MTELTLIQRAENHAHRLAFRDGSSTWTYRELLDGAKAIGCQLLSSIPDLAEARIAFLLPAGFEYAATMWAIWQAGGIAVPLSLSATEPELEYVLGNSEASMLITTPQKRASLEALAGRLNMRITTANELMQSGRSAAATSTMPAVAESRRALILYTSGTTSLPKGVVTTHINIHAQISALVEAWKWQADDCIPLFLPMHHVHGIVNVMSCGLWSGAAIEPFERFDPQAVLQRVLAGAYSVFMAVPTIYVKLIQAIENLDEDQRTAVRADFGRMRLMVSGSAALPATIHQKWSELTGQSLLERYGMTEIGMALSNPYVGERRPGAVGTPLPGVQLRLVDEQGQVIQAAGQPGEIQVKGPAVFSEYWRKPQTTVDAFSQGWFRTGDMALVEEGYYRILGRQSVDIIKSGGYKLSALEIEAVLSDHPWIQAVAVVGLPDDTWGEVVSAAVVCSPDRELDIDALQQWCGTRLSKYKIPKHLLVVDELPRNAMGKVTKPQVIKLFERRHA